MGGYYKMLPAIRVENLAKSYIIHHSRQRTSYKTLRETVTESTARMARRLQHGPSADGSEEFWALQEISFDIQPGQAVGIIGRNGAGKSTLLKILSRITKPTKGRAELRGRLGSLLEVGTGFHPELTGRENIYLNGSILGMTRREIIRRFDEIVAFAEVEQFLDTPVKRYSSGMYVRLAFAVAAHLETEILVVDEVLAVGDAAFQKRCLGKMREVTTGGRSVLFVSHNMAAISQLCETSLFIASGRLKSSGPTADIIIEYLGEGLSSEDGCFDLTNHQARPAGQVPIIRGMILRTGAGVQTTRFEPDDSLEVEFAIDSASPITSPRLALAIEDALGRRIMTLASYFADGFVDEIRGKRRVRCRLPHLRLGSGRYLLSVSIGNKYTGLIDSLDCAAWFEVEWNNHYGNGEPYLPVYGPVVADSEWLLID